MAYALSSSVTGNAFVTKKFMHASDASLPESVTLSFYYDDNGTKRSVLDNYVMLDEESPDAQDLLQAKRSSGGSDFGAFASEEVKAEYFKTLANKPFSITVPITGTTSSYNSLVTMYKGLNSGEFATSAWPQELIDLLLAGQTLAWMEDDEQGISDKLIVEETAGDENNDWTAYARFYTTDTTDDRVAEANAAGVPLTSSTDRVTIKNNNAEIILLSRSDDAERGFEFEVVNWPNVHINVTKDWQDGDNRDQKRADSVEVELYRDGVDTGQKLTLSAANNWSSTFTAEKYEHSDNFAESTDDREYVYTVKEITNIPEYDTEVTGSAVDGFTITNTHTPATISIPVLKQWSDNSDQDGKRASEVTVQLYADGAPVDDKTLVLSAANSWRGTFSDLFKYQNGQEINYTVQEVGSVEGYTPAVTGDVTNGFVVTNSHTPETTSINVSKTWVDEDNQDGLRPQTVTVSLLADGSPVEGKTLTLDALNSWSGSFSDVDVYKDGSPITYTVSETAVPDYTTSYGGDASSGFTITNTHVPLKTSVTVNKVWADGNNQDGLQPETVTVQLYAGDSPVSGKMLSLSASTGWRGSFTDLPVYDQGILITYTVKEVGLRSEYTSEVSGTVDDGFTITNTHVPFTTEVSVEKSWEDANDQDRMRPEEVTVELLADGVVSQSVTLNAENQWKHTFTDLDLNNAGSPIAYTVRESNVPEGYTPSTSGTAADGFTITNTHEVKKTSVTVTKTWNDANNQDGIRGSSVTIQLLANGRIVTGQTATLSASNAWTYTFANLDLNRDGAPIEYTVEETSNIDGYTPDVTGDSTNGFTVTNTHEVYKTSVTVSKTWVDDNNRDGLRPESVTVQLLADGELVDSKTVTLNDSNSWQDSFADLDVNKNGQPIAYTVQETPVPTGYTVNISGSAAEGFTITNTHNPEKISIPVTKAWNDADNQDGLQPEEVTVQLIANGQDVTGSTLTLTKTGGWTGSFADLYAKENGESVAYSVRELTTVDGYVSDVSGSQADGFTITNAHTPLTTSVAVHKVWVDDNNRDGLRPTEVTVRLLANGEAVSDRTVVLNAANDWAASFDGLAVNRAGQPVAYTVEEVGLSDAYESEITGSAEDGYTVTNTHTSATTTVSVSKTWVDDNNRDGIRPENVTVQLYANGEAVSDKTLTLNEANEWKGTFSDLAANNAGAAIAYTVQETEVPSGYTAAYTGDAASGFVVTNTHTPETLSIPVTKVWADANNQDGIRPENVTVQLVKAGEPVDGTTLTLNADNEWKGTFENLYKFEAGQEVTYSVAEPTVAEGYTVAVSGTASDGFTLTNTYEPLKTNVSVTKVWADANNQDGIRPSSLIVRLVADGTPVEDKTLTLNAENNWAATFTDLDVNKAGVAVVYSVQEVSIPTNYTVELTGDAASGFTLTNTHLPDTTTVSVSKTWVDDNNRDGIRPENVTVQLYANGEAVSDKTLTLNEANEWKGTFSDLAANNAGAAIAYTVQETEVPSGYTAAYTGDAASGFVVTNTHTPETLSIPVTKVWADANNQDGIRPENVTVQLVKAGEPVDGTTLTLNADNEWKGTFENLYKFEAGQEVTYDVSEINIPLDYTVTTTGDMKEGFIITNTHVPEPTPTPVEPDQPEQPEEPKQPEQPATPEEPVQPEKPASNPKQPETPKKESSNIIPRTADSAGIQSGSAFALAALGFGIAAAGGVLTLRKHKELR